MKRLTEDTLKQLLLIIKNRKIKFVMYIILLIKINFVFLVNYSLNSNV